MVLDFRRLSGRLFSPLKAARIIQFALNRPRYWYEDTALLDRPEKRGKAARTAGEIYEQMLRETPQYFPGSITYQRASKFLPITLRNFRSYTPLGTDGVYTFTTTPTRNAGYAFSNADIRHCPREGMAPVLQLELREGPVRGYRQAFRLRIREEHARRGVATGWYAAYVERFGGIVSDHEHLEGGKQLWRSFVDTAQARGLRVTLVDIRTGTSVAVDADTADTAIWSRDASKKNQVLVLEKAVES